MHQCVAMPIYITCGEHPLLKWHHPLARCKTRTRKERFSLPLKVQTCMKRHTMLTSHTILKSMRPCCAMYRNLAEEMFLIKLHQLVSCWSELPSKHVGK